MPGMPYGMGMPQYGGPGQSSFPSPRGGPGGAFPYPGAGGQYSPRGGSPRGTIYKMYPVLFFAVFS